MATLKSKSQLKVYLAKIGAQGGVPTVKVGFFAKSTYPDLTPVATIAAYNEFGVPSHNQPPRPFFRKMIEENKASWPKAIALNFKATGFDADKTLDRVGQAMASELVQSIEDLMDPPLAPSTIARKEGKTKGKSPAGHMGSSKPLIDTGVMRNSVEYLVDDGS